MNDSGKEKASAWYRENEKLIHSLSHRVFRRTVAAHLAWSYEDVFQELSLVLVKALQKFDPNRGKTFPAYYTAAAFNRMNKMIEREANITIGLKLVSDSYESEDGKLGVLTDNIASAELSPDLEAMKDEWVLSRYKKMSPRSKKVFNWMINPPQFLLDEIAMSNQKSIARRSEEFVPRSRTFCLTSVLDVFQKTAQINSRERYRIRAEVAPVVDYL